MREIVASIEEAGAADEVDSDLLPRLRGRLLFSRSLAFGRCGGVAIRALGEAIRAGPGRRIVIRGELARALWTLRRHLLEARPREIRCVHSTAPLLFFDGAFEPLPGGGNLGSVGGILLDPHDQAYEFFRLQLSGVQVRFLLGLTGQTAIFELELLPVVVGRRLWQHRLTERSLICFVDNEAAKCALIAGYSAKPAACSILDEVAVLDVRGGTLPWYDRVSSVSNLADAPSRGEAPLPLDGWSAPKELLCRAEVDDIFIKLRSAAPT